MKDKWSTFRQSNSSHIDIAAPHKGDKSLKGDWARESEFERTRINGVLLSEYAKLFNHFASDKDVLDFFETVILKDFKGSDPTKADAERRNALKYLGNTFHQGGLLYPVSSALTTSFKDKDGVPLGVIRDSALDQKINIVTTPHGFKIQEFVSVGEILVNHGPMKPFANDEWGIVVKPIQPEESLILAEGMIEVDFSHNANLSTLKIESNKMQINHPELEKQFDKRSIGQIIYDFLARVFGGNTIQDISPKVDVSPPANPQENLDEKDEDSEGMTTSMT